MDDPINIDDTLRDAFSNAAESGDSTGVADAIRSRVAAGDTGTSVTGSCAPGFVTNSFTLWMGIVLAVGLVAGVVTAGLGTAGFFGSRVSDITVVGATSILRGTAFASGCPGGPVVTSLSAGTRVLARERSADSSFIGIRNPADFSSIVWLKKGDVTIDESQPAFDTLPVGEACPLITVSTPQPIPTEEAPPEDPTPSPTAPPVTPKETVAPVLGTPKATPDPLFNIDPLTITVTGTDNVGITSVSVTWSGQYTGSAAMTFSAGKWRYTFIPPNDNGGLIAFTVVARDAAGNTSTPTTVVVDHQYFG